MQNPSKHNIVLWDLDNTMWDWTAFAAKVYPAMRDKIVEITRSSRDHITALMRDYYDEAGTMESAWFVESLKNSGEIAHLSEVEVSHLETQTSTIYHELRRKHLKLLPDIRDVLEEIIDMNHENIVLTDAPAFHAMSRLKHFGLDNQLISKVIAQPDAKSELIPVKYQNTGENYGSNIPVEIAKVAKPFTDLETHLGMSREEIRERVMIIGDNKAKDIELARTYDCRGVHAKWASMEQEDLNSIRDFKKSPLSPQEEVALIYTLRIIEGRYPKRALYKLRQQAA